MNAGAAAIVVDTWAAIALLRSEEPAVSVMRRLLRRATAGNLRLLLNLINFGETYYRMVQLVGQPAADERLELLRALPLEIVPVKEPLVLEAARLKAQHSISYADAFAVATARIERCPVITGDPEILALPRSVVQVRRLER